MTSEYSIRQYEKKDEAMWDEFVERTSINGTFLQSRRFLNYHPKDRFRDFSLIIEDSKGHIAAVCPACMIDENGERKFISHMGSTFGGLIISPKHYYAYKIIEIIQCVEGYLKGNNITYIELRITPDLFALKNSALLEYCLFYCGYQEFCELSTYVDFSHYKESILSNFEQGKRTNVHNCIKEGLSYRKIESTKELSTFYELLCKNLLKYKAKPVHLISELLDLKRNRLQEETDFYGVFNGNEMIAGAMMFYFHRTNVAHTQYLCAEPQLHTLSPMTYLYFAMIKEMKEQGFSKISFGISTEDKGKTLNYGLTRSKEAYGGEHCINRKFCKNI